MSYMSYVIDMSIFMNYLKSLEIAWNHLIFVFRKIEFFSSIYKDRKSKLENKNIERKYLSNMQKNQLKNKGKE